MTQATQPSIETVLDNPAFRDMVDAIEDTLSSLRGREDDETLNQVLQAQINELEAASGYRYEA